MKLNQLSIKIATIALSFSLGCGEDEKPRTKWAPAHAAPAPVRVAPPPPPPQPVQAVVQQPVVKASDFNLDLVYDKVVNQGVKDPEALQSWINDPMTTAINVGVDVNPQNGTLDAILVSMEYINGKQCMLFGAVEADTMATPYNVGRICFKQDSGSGQLQVQATYPTHVNGSHSHSYGGSFSTGHFVTGMLAGAMLHSLLTPSYTYRPYIRPAYWGGGFVSPSRRVIPVSQRSTIRTTYTKKNKVVAPVAKPRPKGLQPSKSASRTQSRFKQGATVGKPGDSKIGSRQGVGSKFQAGPGNKPVKNNNSFLSKGSQQKAAAAKQRATLGGNSSGAKKRATLPTNRPTTNRPTNRPTSRPANRPTSRPTHRPTNRPTSRPSTRRPSSSRSRPSKRPSSRPRKK